MRESASQKPKIVFVVPAIAHEGISKQVLLQINALQSSGYPVFLISLTTIDASVLAAFAPDFEEEKMQALRQPDPYLSVRSLLRSVAAAKQYNSLLKKINPEVILAHAPYAHFVTRLGALLNFRQPTAIRLWQYFHITQYVEFPLNNWRRKMLNNLNKWLAKRFDYGHIFVSKAVKKDIAKNLVELSRSRVIYNALPDLSPDTTSGGMDSESAASIFTILVPGRIEETKGQVWFLDALKRFIAQEQLRPEQVQVVFAGEGSKSSALAQEVEHKQLQPFVKVLGRLPNDELLCKMNESSLVVVPSFAEGLPLIILEALQQEATVLASDIPPNREVICSNEIGFLFEAGNTVDCVKQLQFIYQNRGQKLIEAEKVKEYLHQYFSFEKHMQELISVIEND